MPKSQGDKILTALAGEYYVAAELCRRGYMASLTLKNYPKVDIFALDPATQRQTAIQVKTVRQVKGLLFFVPKDAGDFNGFFAFVVLPPVGGYETYLLPGQDVARLAKEAGDKFMNSHSDLDRAKQPLMVGLEQLAPFREKWEIIFPH